MVVPAVTKTSTLPGRASWHPRGFLAEIFPDKVLIYLIYLATLSTLPTFPCWQPRSPVGNLDRDGRRFVAHWDEQLALGWTERELFGLHPRPVIMLTATEAVMRCASGATLTYRRQNEPTPGPQPALDNMGPTI
jgi:hypothetical protein